MATPHIFEPEYYQRLYEIEERHGWARGMRDAMLALLRRPTAGAKALRVLDVGCGTGYLLDFLCRHYPVEGEPVGIDLSPHALEYCRQRGARSLALASAIHLPFANHSFDLVICIDTIQHVSPAGADRILLAEIMRVLRPGGVVYLRTNSAWGHHDLEGVDAAHYRRYDLQTVNDLLRDVGLEVVRSTYINAIPGVWAMLKERRQAKKSKHDHHHHHHDEENPEPGLAIRPYPPHLAWVGYAIRAVLAGEAWVMGRLQGDLAFGHSTAYVARRPPGPV